MIKIKILRDTACENLEGQIVEVKKDQLIEVPNHAGYRLIDLGSALEMPKAEESPKPEVQSPKKGKGTA
jgi:hypothetical protein